MTSSPIILHRKAESKPKDSGPSVGVWAPLKSSFRLVLMPPFCLRFCVRRAYSESIFRSLVSRWSNARAAQRLSRNRALVALQTSTLFSVSRTRFEGRRGDSVWSRFSASFFNDLQPNEVVRVLRLSTEQARKSWKNRAGSSKAKTPELGWRNRENGARASTAIGG